MNMTAPPRKEYKIEGKNKGCDENWNRIVLKVTLYIIFILHLSKYKFYQEGFYNVRERIRKY